MKRAKRGDGTRTLRVDLTEGEYEALRGLAKRMGIGTSARLVRWLVRVWLVADKVAGGAPSWHEDMGVKLALIRLGKARMLPEVDPWEGEYEDIPADEPAQESRV